MGGGEGAYGSLPPRFGLARAAAALMPAEELGDEQVLGVRVRVRGRGRGRVRVRVGVRVRVRVRVSNSNGDEQLGA